MLATLKGYRPLEVVVEPSWPWIHDALDPTEIGFHLAHASRLEAIAKAGTKTHSVDAELLARMLATGLIGGVLEAGASAGALPSGAPPGDAGPGPDALQ